MNVYRRRRAPGRIGGACTPNHSRREDCARLSASAFPCGRTRLAVAGYLSDYRSCRWQPRLRAASSSLLQVRVRGFLARRGCSSRAGESDDGSAASLGMCASCRVALGGARVGAYLATLSAGWQRGRFAGLIPHGSGRQAWRPSALAARSQPVISRQCIRICVHRTPQSATGVWVGDERLLRDLR